MDKSTQESNQKTKREIDSDPEVSNVETSLPKRNKGEEKIFNCFWKTSASCTERGTKAEMIAHQESVHMLDRWICYHKDSKGVEQGCKSEFLRKQECLVHQSTCEEISESNQQLILKQLARTKSFANTTDKQKNARKHVMIKKNRNKQK